ncbi:MAG TPA: hypothetical protein VIZ86_16145, partial [Pseudomonas sp.]
QAVKVFTGLAVHQNPSLSALGLELTRPHSFPCRRFRPRICLTFVKAAPAPDVDPEQSRAFQ